MKINKNILKTAAVFIIIFFFMTSAAEAAIKINNKENNSVNDEPKITLLGDNYVWEDPFNNAQKIDLTLSENYIVEDGKVIMIDTYTQWTDPAWQRMKIISLNSEISGEVRIKIQVDYDTDMKNDYGDIRFKFQNDSAWLPYWIEEKNPVPSDPYAIFWVKIPNLPTGSSEMYMFYKNPAAVDESDYWSVFDEGSWVKQFNIDERITNHWYKEGAWDPDVCFGKHDNDDVFLVTWEEGTVFAPLQGTVFEQQIRARYYDKDGNAISDRFDIVDEPEETSPYRYENPSGAYGKDNKFFVAYNRYTNWNLLYGFLNMDIEGAIVDTAVDGASTRFTICDATNLQADPCVAYDENNDRFFVVWEDARQGTSNYDIYGRFFSSSGSPIGDAFAICNQPSTQCEPWIAFDSENNHYLIVWEHSTTSDPENGPFEIWGQLFTWQGSSIGSRFKVSPSASSGTDYNFPCVEFCGLSERFLVTWQEDDISDNDWNGPIWGKIYDKDGNVEIPTFSIANGDFTRTDIVPYLTSSFFVSFDSYATSSGDIWGKMVNDTGSVNSYSLQLSDINTAPCDWASIATDGNKIFVTWEDTRVEYPDPFDLMPDPYFNIWSLDIATASEVTYLFGDEISMILDAHIVSIKIEPDNLVEWVIFDAIKTGDVQFDILDGDNLAVLIPNISPGQSLDGITVNCIRLKARFTRANPSTTPELDYWKVEYIGRDTEPPLTTVKEREGIKGKRDIWISDGVIIWLMAQDFPEDTGSGVDKTYYILDDGPTEVYSDGSGIQLSVDSGMNYLGEWDVYYWSVDKAGNVESPPKHEYVKIDAERPYCEITFPEEEADVNVPFWIKAYARDNDQIDYVEFNIEPFEKRVAVPVFYPGPYEWYCNVEQINNTLNAIKTGTGTNAMIRAQAYDLSGQTWLNEYPVWVNNWKNHSRIRSIPGLIFNKIKIFKSLKLAITFDKTLDFKIPTPSNADSIKFVATKVITGKETTVIDNDFSDGVSVSFDIPTGFYKITVTTYEDGIKGESNVLSRVFFVNK